MTHQPTSELTRRSVLRGAAAGGVGLPLVAACGGGAGGSGPGAAPAGKPGDQLAKTSDVPVGGGTILPDQKVVLTQPTEGDFKGFSAICTHAGCPVSSVSDGEIHCPCHGSAFSIRDGAVVGGPAPRPLPPVKVEVDGSEIVRG